MNQINDKKVFVVAANIAAELHFAVKQARNLSLTAKNARAIAIRAGNRTAGFRAITDYIDTLSHTTIQQAQNINHLAIKISQIAVSLARTEQLIEKYQQVKKTSAQATFISSIDEPLKAIIEQKEALHLDFRRCNHQLSSTIDDARKQMRSANVIATSSKVEASQAGEFKNALNNIANNIEHTSEEIKKHLDNAIKLQNSQM